MGKFKKKRLIKGYNFVTPNATKEKNGNFISIVNPHVKFQDSISNGSRTSASVTHAEMDR